MTILIIDALAGFCMAGVQEELADFMFCAGGNALGWAYLFSSMLTLGEVLILAGAPPPTA